MNGEETLALWRQGKNAWDNWRRAAEDKKAKLAAAGQWSVDWYGEGQNDETKAWLEEATAEFGDAVFDTDADFAGVRFPGPVNFDGARFAGQANFSGAAFAGNASFERTQFEAASIFTSAKFQGFTTFAKAKFAGDASFEKAAFLAVSDLAPCVRFYQTQFGGNAGFTGARFAGSAEFVKAGFVDARFNTCEFQCDALFTSASFAGQAAFTKARFTGACVDFERTAFHSEAQFTDAHFGGSWAGLVISGACNVSFKSAHFDKGAFFHKAWFIGESDFEKAVFTGETVFSNALFVMPARFVLAIFSAGGTFADAQFVREAHFTGAGFLEEGVFRGAKFGGAARFGQARFAAGAQFGRAEFKDEVIFCGADARAALDFNRARCVQAPDFTGASFAQSPDPSQLVMIKPKWRLFGGGKSEKTPADRWGKRGAARETPLPDTQPEEIDEVPFAVFTVRTTAAALKGDAGSASVEVAAGVPSDAEGVELSGSLENRSEPAVASADSSPADGAAPAAGSPPETDEVPSDVCAATVKANGGSASVEDAADAGVPSGAGPSVKIPGSPEAASAEPAAASAAASPADGAGPAGETPPETAPSTGGIHRPAGSPARRRSMARPLIAWMLTIALFMPFYLIQRPDTFPAPEEAASVENGKLSAKFAAFLSRASQKAIDSGPCIHGNSHPASEALFLSAKNAAVFVPWENEHVIRRVYGCLYGLENAAPVIPAAVSLGGLAQALISVTFLAMLLIAVLDRVRRK